ncbi:TPA: DUF551 domain-containing protein [Enterobacter cloacae subsp. cloacae]|nr:DUF551 domain-containing protein [Enterobacter cloacae subsp. cloacae]HED2539763.1 DUF551 domain-containing protein [Enterobacter cloacae subsp. cloacae]
MITLTKEWLLKTIAELEADRDAVPGVVNEDATMALAAMKLALASLEAEKNAEPVAKVDTVGVCWYADNGVPRKPVLGTELYTAPPAPVSVPAAMKMDDDFDSAFEHGKAVGWNAYRAAMLQSFGNSEQLNSPVIPDGWVACSELMPEQFKAILAFNEYGEVWSGAYDRYWNFYCDNLLVEHVTHWMPLPAAPQQEA